MSPSSQKDMFRTPSTSSVSTDITEPSSWDGTKVKPSIHPKAFSRWRPSYHLQAPSGWMNDPCAPTFDSEIGLYRISYQSNLDLKNPDWGDIAWRSATSPDLVSWTIDPSPTLSPDTPYDRKGVFTGCMLPSQTEPGTLACVYTSISALPIHHTLPHLRGSESLSIAKSVDGGRNWEKFAGNPILSSEPEGLDVTGWRDPYVSLWPGMADFLGLPTETTLFGIISGGIRDVTPTTFLYSIPASNVTKWQYIGPLVDVGCNMRPSRWSGDLGKNWEVTNFMTLKDDKDSSIQREFLVMGTEGCLPTSSSLPEPESRATIAAGPSRPLRGQLWMSGALKPGKQSEGVTASPVQMRYEIGGHLDHGCLYAANSFFDPKTCRNIVWGWITEEDLCDELRHAQGWSGLLSLPREVRLQTVKNVLRAWTSELKAITSIECDQDAQGTVTVRTLASEPVPSVVEKLRRGANLRRGGPSNSLSSSEARDLYFASEDVRTNAWELDCSFRVSRRCSNIGVQLIHSKDFSQVTTLRFSPPSETFTIDRPSAPSAGPHTPFNSAPEISPHTLFTSRNPQSGAEDTEPLRIRAWRDNSVLEVFVNGRTAISTRLYAAEETVGIRLFADDGGPSAVSDTGACDFSALLQATLWDGIGVPERGGQTGRDNY